MVWIHYYPYTITEVSDVGLMWSLWLCNIYSPLWPINCLTEQFIGYGDNWTVIKMKDLKITQVITKGEI